jgi:3-(3-hydroxy-phenyl)propionate hydroxylase
MRAVQVPTGRERTQAVEHVRDPDGHLRSACQLQDPGWALVRPDGYLAATGHRVDGRLAAALERSLGQR